MAMCDHFYCQTFNCCSEQSLSVCTDTPTGITQLCKVDSAAIAKRPVYDSKLGELRCTQALASAADVVKHRDVTRSANALRATC